MPQWLEKAKAALRGAPDEPQPFDVRCGCGHRLSGIRETDYQTRSCPRCGNTVFILPADVYPIVIPRPTQAGKPAEPKPTAQVPAATAVAPKQPRRSAVAVAEEEAEVEQGPGAVETALKAAQEKVEKTAAGTVTAVRRFWTPFRTVAAAILFAIGLTGFTVWRSRTRDVAAVDLGRHLEAANEALERGAIGSAATEFTEARKALDKLGRKDAEAERTRQKARELIAIDKLSTASLYEICEQGARRTTEDLAGRYRDAWLIIEGTLRPGYGPDGRAAVLVDYPLHVGNEPVIFFAPGAVVSQLGELTAPRKAIFAGRLASIRREGSRTPTWCVRLHDDSAFLWEGGDTFQLLGGEADDLHPAEETKKLLDAQSAVRRPEP